MDRNNSHLTWEFHYNSLLQSPRAVYTDSRYPYSTAMATERTGSFLTPCYWPPPPYSAGPYGVSQQHGSTPSNVGSKRTGINSCECSVCVTTSSQTYKPVFAHPSESLKTTSPIQGFTAPKDISQSREAASPDVQGYTTKAVSPPVMCLPNDDVIGTGPRRGRTVFTAQQLQVLERVFASTQYIVGSQRKFLANQLRLSETQVRVWFQNRRIKWRKQMLTRSINS